MSTCSEQGGLSRIMISEELTGRTSTFSTKPGSGTSRLRDLVLEGFLDNPVSSAEIVRRIGERFSERWITSEVQPFIVPLVRAGIVHGVRPDGVNAVYWVISDISRDEALRILAKGRRIAHLEHELFSETLSAKLSKSFSAELNELHDVFGRHGNCTAFLLRKILEKLLIIVFRKTGKGSLIEDRTRPGRLIGLESMIDLATREKTNGAALLSGRTAGAIRGVKFLGDAAAHNAMANVEMAEIIPQMPFIIVAYKELAHHL